LSEDPFGFGGGDWNLSAYVKGNPITNIDPNGLWAKEVVSWGLSVFAEGFKIGTLKELRGIGINKALNFVGNKQIEKGNRDFGEALKGLATMLEGIFASSEDVSDASTKVEKYFHNHFDAYLQYQTNKTKPKKKGFWYKVKSQIPGTNAYWQENICIEPLCREE